jgi:lysophospholipase L1-like esterase
VSKPSIVLLGDSILDNGPYTRPAPDTTAILGDLLGTGWSIERLAQDGAALSDVKFQLDEMRGRPDIGILSVGGNDAVKHIGILNQRASSAAEVLSALLDIAEEFGRRYEAVARSVAERVSRLVLCTIYNVPLEPAPFDRLARVPLALLNDRIIGAGARLEADVLELRSVCTERSDFVLQMEPSARGASKIARAIAQVVQDRHGLLRTRVSYGSSRAE